MKNDKEFEEDEKEINKILEKVEKKRIWVETNMESVEKWLDSSFD
jgi:dsDNA-specific endonuclease/ATPase MutS2